MSEAERDRLISETLELAALRLEAMHGSVAYTSAFRRGAREVRMLKPECQKFKGLIKDTELQISDE